MIPFLKQVVQHYYADGTISEQCFILPNRRSVAFLLKYLGEEVGRTGVPAAAPLVFTMNDFFYRVAGRTATGNIQLLVTLYNCYRELNPKAEELDEFLFWGGVLLSDFNDVDKYLVNPAQLFANVADFREIQDSYEYLSKTQEEALKQFLSHFRTPGDYKQKFLGLWSLLLPLYRSFNERLRSEGDSYEGMVYRSLAERLDTESVVDVLPEEFSGVRKFVFVGLNALNECEKRLLSRMRDAGIAEFCWDYSSTMIKDRANKSSFFLSVNVTDYPQAFEPDPQGLAMPSINAVSIPSAVGQAKQIPAILESLPRVDIGTAIVLPDEDMLIPVLNSIPSGISSLNVTMGYPMSGSELWSLMNDICALQSNIRERDGRTLFYHRNVWSVFSNSIFRVVLSPEGEQAVEAVKKAAGYYVDSSELRGDPVLDCIFRPAGEDVPGYLQAILETVAPKLTGNPEMAVELDFAHEYYLGIGTLRNCRGLDVKPATFFRLLGQLIRGISVPFRGEPLEGLQIMGPLETRALDFENLVILNCNEGIFPRRSVSASFVPAQLRGAFGLPTYEYQDAVWAYYFYRMIQRASQVWMLYDSRMDVSRSGEVSRYLSQLEMHFGVEVNHFVTKAPLSVESSSAPLPKTPEMILSLREKTLSASAIKNYLACPAMFHYHTVCALERDDEVQESMDAGAKGNVFHAVMEELYTVEGGFVTREQVKSYISDRELVKGKVRAHILEEMKVFELSGRNIIYEDLICRYVTKVLQRDLELMDSYGVGGFRVLGLELKKYVTIDGFRFVGYIDRMDSFVPSEIRIVDYKTGAVDETQVGIQLYLYDRMIKPEASRSGCAVVNSVYQVSRLFVEPVRNVSVDPGDEEKFSTLLSDTLREIADPSVPFARTEDKRVCGYCSFRQICGR